MEFKFALNDTHTRPVLCTAINPSRREIFTGSEDATIKIWEYDTGKLMHTLTAHNGYVTSLIYCKDLKILLSTSLDGNIIAWGPSGKLLQIMETKMPIYCSALHPGKYHLMVGHPAKVRVYRINTGDEQITANEIIDPLPYYATNHTDLVRSVVCIDGKFCSAGYDRRLIVYNSPHHSLRTLKPLKIIENAHESGITAMTHGRDAENSWIITTSFDKSIKVWSMDGVLIHRFDGFTDTITSMTFNNLTNTLWITASSATPIIYDPRTGLNITEFMSNRQAIDIKITKTNAYGVIKHLFSSPDGDELIAFTSRRNVFIWKYNPSAPISILNGHSDTVESLAITSREPLYVFSGGGDGNINRWEPFQLNSLIFTRTDLTGMISDNNNNNNSNNNGNSDSGVESRTANRPRIYDDDLPLFPNTADVKSYDARRKMQIDLHKHIQDQVMVWQGRWSQLNRDPGGGKESWSRILSHQVKLMSNRTMEDFKLKDRQLAITAKRKGVHLENGYDQDLASLLDDRNGRGRILKLVYYDELDILICGTDVGTIYVYSYGQIELDIGKPGSASSSTHEKIEVSGKMANMVCKYRFENHRSGASAIVCFKVKDRNWMVSAGWDKKLLIWDLDSGKLHDGLHNNNNNQNLQQYQTELAADGIILDMDYSKEMQSFAYSSGDYSIYLRRFSETGRGDEMQLIAVMQGHESEVNCVRWSPLSSNWISGGEDQSIRVWSSDGLQCLKRLSNEAPVHCLTVDAVNGCLITGSQDGMVRVFDPLKEPNLALCQRLQGHQHAVRSIVHLVERNQYLSASWDHTIHVWKAYFRKGQQRRRTKSNPALNPNPTISPGGDAIDEDTVTTSAVGDQNGGDVGIDVSSKTGVQTDISKNSSIMLKKLAMNVENTANDIRNILKGLSDKTRADTAQEREVNERNVIDQEMDRALNELERALQQQQLQSDGPTAAGDGGLLPGGKRSQRRSVLKQ